MSIMNIESLVIGIIIILFSFNKFMNWKIQFEEIDLLEVEEEIQKTKEVA